jgi:hypothetical protein
VTDEQLTLWEVETPDPPDPDPGEPDPTEPAPEGL